MINKGQQIGLMIFSSDRGHTILPKAGTELTVDLDRTTLTIPVVGGTVAFREVTEQRLIYKSIFSFLTG